MYVLQYTWHAEFVTIYKRRFANKTRFDCTTNILYCYIKWSAWLILMPVLIYSDFYNRLVWPFTEIVEMLYSLNSSKGLYGNTRATTILPLGFTAFFISSKSFVGLLHRSNKFRHDTTSNFSSRVHHVSTSNNLLTIGYYLDTIMTTVSTYYLY